MRLSVAVFLIASPAFSQMVNYGTQIRNKPIRDIREHGAKCDNAASDNAAFTLAEASASETYLIPPGTCVITGLTLTKRYIGEGYVKLDGVLQAKDYARIATTTHVPVADIALPFKYSQRWGQFQKTHVTAFLGNFGTTSSYLQYPYYQRVSDYEVSKGSAGFDAFVSATSSSGTNRLYVNYPGAFSINDPIIISRNPAGCGITGASDEAAVVAAIGATYIDLVGNMASTHDLTTRDTVCKSTRVLMTPYWSKVTTTAPGDAYNAFFENHVYTPARPGATHWLTNGVSGFFGGGVALGANGNYAQFSEFVCHDDGGLYDGTCIGEVRNFSRGNRKRSWATQVDQDSNSGAITLFLADTTSILAGDVIRIAAGTARDETKTVFSVNPGVSVALTAGLSFTHTAVQADWVDTSAYSSLWGDRYVNCGGAYECDFAAVVGGKYRSGYSFAAATLDANQAAIMLKNGQMIYFNSTVTSDSAGLQIWSPTYGVQKMGFDGVYLSMLGVAAKLDNNQGLFWGGAGSYVIANASEMNLAVGSANRITVNNATTTMEGNSNRPFTSARTPASSSEACSIGTMSYDASYLYICVSTNTWRRMAHSAF